MAIGSAGTITGLGCMKTTSRFWGDLGKGECDEFSCGAKVRAMGPLGRVSRGDLKHTASWGGPLSGRACRAGLG